MGLRAVNETDASQYKQFWSHNYTDPAKFPYVEVTYSQPATYTSADYDRLRTLNPDLTAAALDAELDQTAAVYGLSYQQAIMRALAAIDSEPATTYESSETSATSSQMTTFGTNPKCVRRDLGNSRYRGDIFWSAAATYGISHGHIGIFYQTNVVIEARGSGTVSATFNVSGRSYCKNIEKMDVATSISTQKKAADYAYNHLRGKPYDPTFWSNKNAGIDDLNCSELVWKAYRFPSGVKIDLDGGWNLGVYPNDIKKSDNTRTYQTIS